MAPRKDLIVFLDLETTGNDEADEIIEIGMVMLKAPDWQEIGSFSQVVYPNDSAWDRLIHNDVVYQMHQLNGLLLDATSDKAVVREKAEGRALAWLDGLTDGSTTHIPLGGSGVSHFDRPYLRREMPDLSKRFTYWAYDVGVVRRMYELTDGIGWPSQDGKTHRALDDARVHAEEFRYGLELLGEGARASHHWGF